MLFAENQQQTGGRIHYVLFNPWAVRSNITHLIDNPPHTALSAFIKTKPVDLTMNTFDRGKAVRLDDITKSC